MFPYISRDNVISYGVIEVNNQRWTGVDTKMQDIAVNANNLDPIFR